MPEPFSILELRRQSGARARRGQRWRLALVVAVVLFVVAGLTGLFVAPPPVRHYCERRLSAVLHHEVRIRALRFNPCVFSATLSGLEVRDSNGRMLFSCERVYTNFDSWSFFSDRWTFQEISLTAPKARLEINRDGTVDLSGLFSPALEKSAGQRPIVIGQLTVDQARIEFIDHRRAQDFTTTLGPLDFSLKNFSTVPVSGTRYEFTASTELGETLHWSGSFSANPLRSAGEFALGHVALKKYAPYYAEFLRGDVLAGTLDAAGHYEVDFSVEPRAVKFSGGELHVHGLQLAAHGGDKSVVDLPAVDLAGLDVSLTPLKISAARLVLAGGHIAAQRTADGTLNLAAMFVPALAALQSAPGVSLAALEVRGLGLTLDDATAPRLSGHAIESLDLSAQNLSFGSAGATAPILLKLALRAAPQGSLSLDGKFTPAPLRADFAVDLADFPLADADSYLESWLNLHITQGTMSAHGQLTLTASADANAAPQIVFHGDAEVERFASVDVAGNEDFVSFASLGFKQLSFTSAPLALAAGQVSLIEPAIHFTRRQDGSTNFETILRRDAAENSDTKISVAGAMPGPATTSRSPKISFDRVVLSDGALVLADRSIEPNVRLVLNQLAGIITGLSSDDFARATVDLRAKVDNTAPVTIAGQVNLFSSDAFADLTASCTDVDLEDAGPYLARYGGYALVRGSLDLDLKIHFAQRRLDSWNTVTLDQFVLGEKTDSAEAMRLPVPFAVALLKDKNGRIAFNLPLQGSLDDPDFSVGRAVLRGVTDLVAKAVADPLAFLGSALGGGQLPDRIDFMPGASVLAPTETQKLDFLARALVARPGLNLDLAGAADSAVDMPLLQKQKFNQQLRAKIWELRHADSSPPSEEFQIDPVDYNRVLATLYFTTFPPSSTNRTHSEAPAAPPAPPHFNTRTPAPQLIVFGDAQKTPEPPPAAAEKAPADETAASHDIVTPEQMETRLAAQFTVDEDALHQLAVDRAQQVKDYLSVHGVSDERMFITEAETGAARVRLHLK